MIEEFINSLNNDTSYDFIANNYYRMSNEELKNILLEVLFAANLDEEQRKSIANELRERYLYE